MMRTHDDPGRHHGGVALVTRANNGIGPEITRRLAAEGVTVTSVPETSTEREG